MHDLILMFVVASGIREGQQDHDACFLSVLFIFLQLCCFPTRCCRWISIIFSESIQRHCPIQSLLDFCSWSGHSSRCPVAGNGTSDLRVLSSGIRKTSQPSAADVAFFEYHRTLCWLPWCIIPAMGHHRCTASIRVVPRLLFIYLPHSDQSHCPDGKNNCYYLLCCADLLGRVYLIVLL